MITYICFGVFYLHPAGSRPGQKEIHPVSSSPKVFAHVTGLVDIDFDASADETTNHDFNKKV